ncbi:MAG: hypothetical protein U0264_12020 [Candidatus Kapaibacterium sp.]
MKILKKYYSVIVILLLIQMLSGCAFRTYNSTINDIRISEIDSITIMHYKVNFTSNIFYGTYSAERENTIVSKFKFNKNEITDTIRELIYDFLSSEVAKIEQNTTQSQISKEDVLNYVIYENDSTYVGIDIYFHNTVYLSIHDFHYAFFKTKYSTYSEDHTDIYSGKEKPNILEIIPFSFMGKGTFVYMRNKSFGGGKLHGSVVKLANNLINQYNYLQGIKSLPINFINEPILRKK